MGRIEEALRRAAEERARGTSHPPADAVGLAEIFPEESSPNEPPVPMAEVEFVPPALEPPPSPFGAAAVQSPLIERINSALAAKVVVDANTPQVSREQYRKLAATLHQAQAASGLKVIMVASAVAGEGKTLTSSNLALTLSESYKRRVFLIDGDLRRPSLHTVFALDAGRGLSEGLVSPAEQRFAVHEVSPLLTILPAGRPSHDPMAGLTSDRMQRLIDEARSAFDWVIVDTPPVGLLPDGHLLAAMVDGVILVVKAGETPYPMVLRALESLGRERVLGVVLNQAAESSARTYYSYKYEYGSRPETAAP
jgi:capsular exopolysaccharide synthesis family protein